MERWSRKQQSHEAVKPNVPCKRSPKSERSKAPPEAKPPATSPRLPRAHEKSWAMGGACSCASGDRFLPVHEKARKARAGTAPPQRPPPQPAVATRLIRVTWSQPRPPTHPYGQSPTPPSAITRRHPTHQPSKIPPRRKDATTDWSKPERECQRTDEQKPRRFRKKRLGFLFRKQASGRTARPGRAAE